MNQRPHGTARNNKIVSTEVKHQQKQNKRWRKQEKHRNSSSLLIHKWHMRNFNGVCDCTI